MAREQLPYKLQQLGIRGKDEDSLGGGEGESEDCGASLGGDGGRGDHVLGDSEQVPQVSGLLLLDMEDADAARPEVEVHSELPVLVVRGLEHLLLPHLAGQGREVDDHLMFPRPWLKQFRKLRQSVSKSLIMTKRD